MSKKGWVTHKGGKKLEALLENAFKGHVKGVETGFYADATYDDGTPVAGVAAAHEFGDGNLPERPFFRLANEGIKGKAVGMLRAQIDPKVMAVDKTIAARLGAMHAGEVKRSITALKSPALDPSTIARKGSSNPLIDTGVMRSSVTYKVDK